MKVSWDDEIPIYGKNNPYVPNHQPVEKCLKRNSNDDLTSSETCCLASSIHSQDANPSWIAPLRDAYRRRWAQVKLAKITIPICSMYGIVTYILAIFGENLSKYSSTMEHMG
jgi:hypothetical protein